ncbi:hypothetical protein NQZ79_g1226 [Umbelopsis isabellina]|nr:hypothetical protein NQZ79_g1226 [Umbelopsis isabellina]
MFRKRKQKQLAEARRREAEMESQKRNQVTLEELQLLRDFRTSLIMPHLAKEFDILRSSSPENMIAEELEILSSPQEEPFLNVASLSPPPRKAKAPIISSTPTGSSQQVAPWMEHQEHQAEEPRTPISETFETNATPSIYSTTSTLDSEHTESLPDQYRDLAQWRAERNKRHYSNQIFGGKQRLDHYRLTKERSKTTLHEITTTEEKEDEVLEMKEDDPEKMSAKLAIIAPEVAVKTFKEAPAVANMDIAVQQEMSLTTPAVAKPLPSIPAKTMNVSSDVVESLLVGERPIELEFDSNFPVEMSRSTRKPLSPLPTAHRPKPRARQRPNIKRYSIDPLSKWMDHATTGYDNDQTLDLNENYFFNDFAPDAEQRRPRPKSRRMSKHAAKHLAEGAAGKHTSSGKIDLAAIAKHLHENRYSMIQEKKRISATQEDEQELAKILADPQQLNLLEMHRDLASSNVPTATDPNQSDDDAKAMKSANEENLVSQAPFSIASTMRNRSASTSRAEPGTSFSGLPKPTGLSHSASMRISPLQSNLSGGINNRPIHFLGSKSREVTPPPINEKSELDDSRSSQSLNKSEQLLERNIPSMSAKEHFVESERSIESSPKKASFTETALLSRAGSIVDRSPSTRIAAIQGIQKSLREKQIQTHVDKQADDSKLPVIEDIPASPLQEHHDLHKKRSTNNVAQDRSIRKEKPRIAILDANAPDLTSPTAFISPRMAPLPPSLDGDAMNGLDSKVNGSTGHEDYKRKPASPRHRTKSSNDADDADKELKGGFLQFRRQVSKLRRPRAGSDATQPKSGLKHAISHENMSKGVSRFGSAENLRAENDVNKSATNGNLSKPTPTEKLQLPNNGQPRRSISMREIRSPSMENEDPFMNMRVRPSNHNKENDEKFAATPKPQPSGTKVGHLHRPSRSISSSFTGSSQSRSNSEDSTGTPPILARNPLRQSRDDNGRQGAPMSRSSTTRDRQGYEHTSVRPKAKNGHSKIDSSSPHQNSRMTSAAAIALKHSNEILERPAPGTLDDIPVKKVDRQVSGAKGMRMLSQLLGRSKTSAKVVNGVDKGRKAPNDLKNIDTKTRRPDSKSRQVVRRTIIYVHPEESDELSLLKLKANAAAKTFERESISSDSSHINSPDSDFTGQEYVTAKVVTRQPSQKKTVVDGEQPTANTGGLTRKGTNGRKWRLENVNEDSELKSGPASIPDQEPIPRSSSSSSIPRSSYDNESIYKFYNSRNSTSDRSLDSVQRSNMRSAAHAQLEGLEVREMSDGSVVYGIVKKDGNGRRTSVLLPMNSGQEATDEDIITSDEDEDDIEERVLEMMGYDPNSPRLSDFTYTDRRSKTSRQSQSPPNKHPERNQRVPPPQYPPPPIPTRSPRRMASIREQQQLKPKVSRVQDHHAKHISTLYAKTNDRDGPTTDIYVAEEVTLSGLLDMIKDTDDAYADDVYGDYYSDQSYFPDSDTDQPERTMSSTTVEERLDDALKTWEMSSSREPAHFR